MNSKTDLRNSINNKRASLSAATIESSCQNMHAKAVEAELFEGIQTLAAYLPQRGEADPNAIIQHCWQQQIPTYLPCVKEAGARNYLEFRAYNQSSALDKNQYGILEPDPNTSELIPADQLSLVLVPLVAFSKEGHRLGMGKGYYDQTFEFLNQKDRSKQPRLIGLAYEFQLVEELPVEAWDVPLDGVLTEQNFYRSL